MDVLLFISFLKYEFNFRKVISPVGWSQRIQPPPPGTSTGHKKSWDQWSQSSLDQTGLGPGPPVIRDPMDLHNLSQASIHLQSEIILFFKNSHFTFFQSSIQGINFQVWLRNLLISAGFKPISRHTENV